MKEDVFASSQVTTLARCLKMTLCDGQIIGFTNHDTDLEIDGITYISNMGFDSSAITMGNSLSVDNVDIGGVLSSDRISQKDILNGRYDFAQIDIFIVNYNNPNSENKGLFQGWFGEVNLKDGKFTAEVHGIKQFLNKTIGELYSPNCRANLGDRKCGVNLLRYSKRAKITKIIDDKTFYINFIGDDSFMRESDFEFGIIELNNMINEIKNLHNRKLELMLPLHEIKIGSEIKLSMGCDKHINTCANKFDNVVNFRGEPHVPGFEKLLYS